MLTRNEVAVSQSNVIGDMNADYQQATKADIQSLRSNMLAIETRISALENIMINKTELESNALKPVIPEWADIYMKHNHRRGRTIARSKRVIRKQSSVISARNSGIMQISAPKRNRNVK